MCKLQWISISFTIDPYQLNDWIDNKMENKNSKQKQFGQDNVRNWIEEFVEE